MAGHPTDENSEDFHPDPLQKEVIGRAHYLSSLTQSTGDLDGIPKPEAALRALLQGRSEYGSELPTTLAACSLERISLPGSLVGSPPAEELLDEEARRYLQCPEQMLRDDEEQDASLFQPYWDPLLRNDPRVYKRFIRKLHQADYLVYTQRPKCMVGVFFVKKSDGKKIRMIIDARGANMRFREPPGVQLLTSDGFSRIEVTPPEGLSPGSEDYDAYMKEWKVHVGLSDVKDCFHRLRQPKWLSEFFCLDSIPASWVGLEGTTLDGVLLQPDSLIYPAPGSLCMGFTWSLFFAQRISERLMGQVGVLRNSRLAFDRGESMQFFTDQNEVASIHHYVYVDNLGILSTDEIQVERGLEEVKETFESRNLHLHPGEVRCGAMKALGCELRGDLMASRITIERFHKLRQAITGVLMRKKVSGRLLEVVVGHATFAGLTNRALLSVFHTTYRYIRTHYDYPSTLWSSVREEMQAFRSLMIYLHADWTRPWNTYVTASDSSLTGYGVVSSTWTSLEVSKVGRCLERGRFKKKGSHSARDSALTAAGFVRDEVAREWRAGVLEANEFLSLSGWELNHDFLEVPGYLLHKDRWTPRLWGLWQYESGILELESRALVKSLRRIALSIFGHDIRQLCLTDNMSVCLAFDRSRSKNYFVLRQIRLFNAYCLSRNISCTIRWIPSELNSADEPSRISTDDSKSLTHAVPILGVKERTLLETAASEEPQHSSKKQGGSKAFVNSELKSAEASPSEKADVGQELSHTSEKASLQSTWSEARREREQGIQTQEKPESLAVNQLNPYIKWKEDKGQDTSSPKEASGQECGGPCLGCEPVYISELLGGPSCEGGNQQAVPSRAQIFPGLCSSPRFAARSEESLRHGGRQPHGGLHESDVPRRISELQGRQNDSGLSSRVPELRQEWQWEDPENLAIHQGLQKAHPGEEPGGLSFCRLGRLCRGDEEVEQASDVNLSPSFGVYLRQTVRAAEGPSVFFSETGAQHQQGMESAFVSRRRAQPNEDRRIRHQPVDRLTLPPWVDREVSRMSQDGASRREAVGFRLRGIPEDVSDHREDVGNGGNTLSDPPQRSIYRQSKKLQVTTRSAKEGTVEGSQKRHEIRKECTPGCNMGVSPNKTAGVCESMRGRAWGNSLRPSSRTQVRRRGPKGAYVMDLFAGEAGVSRACEDLGFKAKFWDLRYGVSHDLTKKSTLQKIRREIKRGRVLACMLAPVCTSFSVARDRTKVIRNRDYPWGIPDHLLSDKERESIITGNRCFQACFKIMRWLDEAKVPYILENPASSKAWFLPPMLQHMSSPHVNWVKRCFCQFGAPWKKPTAFLTGNLEFSELHRLTKVCHGRGTCTRTGKPHFLLTGSRSDGTPWTRVAQPYPRKLCVALAHTLTSYMHTYPTRYYL